MPGHTALCIPLDVLLEEEARQLIKPVKMVSKGLRYVEVREHGLPTASE